MEHTAHILVRANDLYARSNNTCPCPPPSSDSRPKVYKAIGISLAIASGVFIGISFVLKKTGLLKANTKYNEEAGEGYGYLKNAFWWTGMTLMIIGEICNFVAYAFVDAILVTPLGALSVVITAVLSSIFLKERLSFVGKVGCFMCIIGSVVIVMNAPGESSASNIQDMQKFVIAPGFLSYAGVVIVTCAFIALWAGPRYGKKSMLVYLSICSLIGGLSVVATQGLGAAVVAAAGGQHQFNHWFLYVLFVFVIATLLTEIIFLNKALNLFNAALVTPTYYVYFTSSTIITSAILFRGFKGSVTSIITVVMGFFVICAGVVLLQLSKSAKDVPDTAVFKGDLDQVRTVAEQEEPEFEPKADAIRGTAALLRRFSQTRQQNEVAEAKRIHDDKIKDQMEPIGENEQVEWDGLRRRKTVIEGPGSISRRKTLHPPLGMTRFPNEEDDDDSRPRSSDVHGGNGFRGNIFNSFRRSRRVPTHTESMVVSSSDREAMPQRPVTEFVIPTKTGEDTAYAPHPADQGMEMDHVYGLPGGLAHHGSDGHASPRTQLRDKPIMWADNVDQRPPPTPASRGSLAPTPPPHSAKRQFSFTNVFGRHPKNRDDAAVSPIQDSIPVTSPYRPTTSSSRLGHHSAKNSRDHGIPTGLLKVATEEERMGLVKGDSSTQTLPLPEYSEAEESEPFQEEEGWGGEGKRRERDRDRDREAEGDEGSESTGKSVRLGQSVPLIRDVGGTGGGGGDREEGGRRLTEWSERGPPGGGGGSKGSGGAFV